MLFEHEFITWGCINKVITLVAQKQSYYFENDTPCCNVHVHVETADHMHKKPLVYFFVKMLMYRTEAHNITTIL